MIRNVFYFKVVPPGIVQNSQAAVYHYFSEIVQE